MTREDIMQAIKDEGSMIKIYDDNIERATEKKRLSKEKIETFEQMLKEANKHA